MPNIQINITQYLLKFNNIIMNTYLIVNYDIFEYY